MSETDFDGLTVTVTEYDHAPACWPLESWPGEPQAAHPELWRAECVPEDLFEDVPF